ADLAEDLRRFLADRPIRARRTSALEHAWRWCRRNPAVAGLIAAVGVLLMAIAVVSSLSSLRLRKEQQATRHRLHDELVARARAGGLRGRAGPRFASLRALDEAAPIARELKLPAERLRELRNEVIACLALPDVEVAHEWDGHPDGSDNYDFDGKLEHYARSDQ